MKHLTFKSSLLGLLTLAVGVGAGLSLHGHHVSAAACAAPTTDLGSATKSVTVNVPGDYTVWTRLMAPDTTNNSISLQVDGTSCYNVGGAGLTANTYGWVNFQDGSATSVIRPNLTAGTHEFKFIGTKAGVTLDRTVLVADANCVPTGNGDNCAVNDTTPPTVSLTAPTDASTATGIVTISANATDDTGIANVKFSVDGTAVNTDSSAPYTFDWNSTTVPNGSHVITATATDFGNNSVTSTPVTVDVENTAPVCTVAPSTPAKVVSTAATETTITVGWAASTPGTGCTMASYSVYRGSTLVATVSNGTAYTDTGLALNTAYTYQIVATDTLGHASAQSTAVTLRTTTDKTPPSAPANLKLYRAPTRSDIWITWTPSTDNVGVTKYQVFRNGVSLGTTTSTAYDNTGLSRTTTYTYTVKAIDAAGNVSAASNSLIAKTL